jgi:hypothetical protein
MEHLQEKVQSYLRLSACGIPPRPQQTPRAPFDQGYLCADGCYRVCAAVRRRDVQLKVWAVGKVRLMR